LAIDFSNAMLWFGRSEFSLEMSGNDWKRWSDYQIPNFQIIRQDGVGGGGHEY
jgi:hypothetical protein